MSDFVNYNKRSITLPPGCKDLIDVLGREGCDLEWLEKQLGLDLSGAITRGGVVEGTSLDIEKKIRQAVAASALIFILKIAPADQGFTFTLQRLYQRPLQATIELETRTPQEAALQRSLAEHNLRTPDDSIESGVLFPDLPWRLRCPIEPLPSAPLELSRLISEVLRDTGGLTAQSGLAFHHHEIVMPG
jgi:hypothetical protein